MEVAACPHGRPYDWLKIVDCDACFKEWLEKWCERIEWGHLYMEHGGEA